MSNKSNKELLRFFTELRARLIVTLTVVLCVFAVLAYFANHLYTFLALPLLHYLPHGHLIATQIVSPFFVPFKLAFVASLFLTAPFFLYQLWAFIEPALYGHERRFLWPLLFFSSFLFYAGIAFAYYVIFPVLFRFLTQVAPVGVIVSPDIGEYLDFTLNLLLVFGGLFEIPIVMVMLVLFGIVSVQRLSKMRPYAIVSAFVIGMLIAPPDVLSQTLLAVPIWLLYEIGILLSRVIGHKKSKASSNASKE